MSAVECTVVPKLRLGVVVLHIDGAVLLPQITLETLNQVVAMRITVARARATWRTYLLDSQAFGWLDKRETDGLVQEERDEEECSEDYLDDECTLEAQRRADGLFKRRRRRYVEWPSIAVEVS